MASNPTSDELLFVNERTRALVIAQRPRLAQYVGYVAPPPAPVNTTAPIIAGPGTVGAAHTCTPGVWANATTIARQWRRGPANIAGATALTYTPVGLDAGFNLTCRETATNVTGSAFADSNAIAIA